MAVWQWNPITKWTIIYDYIHDLKDIKWPLREKLEETGTLSSASWCKSTTAPMLTDSTAQQERVKPSVARDAAVLLFICQTSERGNWEWLYLPLWIIKWKGMSTQKHSSHRARSLMRFPFPSGREDERPPGVTGNSNEQQGREMQRGRSFQRKWEDRWNNGKINRCGERGETTGVDETRRGPTPLRWQL